MAHDSTDKKVRKLAMCKKTGKCTYCPPHDNENRGRRPRQDKGKNHRRK